MPTKTAKPPTRKGTGKAVLSTAAVTASLNAPAAPTANGHDPHAEHLRATRIANLELAREKRMGRIAAEDSVKYGEIRKRIGHYKQRVQRMYIPLTQLLEQTKVDRDTYQREINWTKVEKIADDFQWEAFDALSLNLRRPEDPNDPGYFAVTDGQHRLEALRWVFTDAPEELIPCDVTGLKSVAEEARIYTIKNTGHMALSYTGALRGRIAMNEERATRMREAVEAVGLHLRTTRKGQGKGQKLVGQIDAGRSLERIMDAGGRKGLDNVLEILKEAFGEDPEGYSAPILEGMWEFILRYHPVIERAWLTERLRRATPLGLLKKGMDPYGTGEIVIVKVGAAQIGLAIKSFYDHGRQEHNRLPDYPMDSSLAGTTTKRLVAQWRATFDIKLDERRRAI